MFKKKKSLLPTTIANYFEVGLHPGHTYNLRRRQNNTNTFRSNTITGQKSIQNEGEKLWRELPPYLKDLDSIIAFKKFYKTYLTGAD